MAKILKNIGMLVAGICLAGVGLYSCNNYDPEINKLKKENSELMVENAELKFQLGFAESVLKNIKKPYEVSPELEEHIEENRQVYEDFKTFIYENDPCNSTSYEFSVKNHDMALDKPYSPHHLLLVKNQSGESKKSFIDIGLNGMRDDTIKLEYDSYYDHSDSVVTPIDLAIAKDYTNTLKQIMHDAGYGDY